MPAFGDVEPDTFNIDAEQVEAMIGPNTKAMMVPSLIGNLPDWDRLAEIAAEHELLIVEDSADTLGATGAFLNLPPGAGTTTMESKTNFIGAAKVGSVVTAESTPIHIGKSTSIWQTRIAREDGKLVAVVTQTQMVLT